MGTDPRLDLNPPDRDDSDDTDVFFCARHPHTETVLRCGRCDTPICPRCLVQSPVGARCPDCANLRRIPTLDVSPQYLARGLGAAVVVGWLVGLAWGWLTGGSGLGFVGFFILFLAMGMGWAVSEAISAATNRKRGTALQACAVGAMVIAYLVHSQVAYHALLPHNDVWGLVGAGFAAFFAANRLKV